MGDDPIIKEAESLASARERIGTQLAAVLSDPDQPVAERHEAARLLARLQFMAAIDVLVQYVDLVDPTARSLEERPDLAYPLTMALAAYGNAAVPQIVDAYLMERNHQRQWLLAYSIRFGDAGRHGERTKVALRYLRGTELPEGESVEDQLKKQKMKRLEEHLQWLADKVVAPDHVKK